MQLAHDFAEIGADPIPSLGEPRIRPRPERDPIGDCRVHRDRSEGGNVLVDDAATFTATVRKDGRDTGF
jgi:hypothetical protein